MESASHFMRMKRPGRFGRALLLALFIADLRWLNRLGLRIKDMRARGRMTWDTRLRQRLQAGSPAMEKVARFASYGERAVLPMDLLAWLWLRRRRPDTARFFGRAVAGVMGLRRLSKPIVRRRRPLFERRSEQPSSFPSGHAADSMALALALSEVVRGSRWETVIRRIALLMAGSIGLSRVVRNRHHPSDVLAGWGLALAWVAEMRALDYFEPGPSK